MKISELWLRTWVNPDMDTEALGHQLTMAGHELDHTAIEGAGLDGVVIAEVVEFAKHPDADRLNVCKVSVGSGELIDVVCGAPNVSKGMKSPLAAPGVKLPNGLKLRKSKIRGIVSNGMLCSAVELGLGDESDGIISLPADAPVGESFAAYMNLPDATYEMDLTPNRGDCFSVLGLARDISAMTGAEFTEANVEPIAATIEDTQAVEIARPEQCPSFAGRVVRNIAPGAKSPLWMTERLRRSGLRPIHPVVDITNYIMLELGQPLHAYDLGLVQGAIRPGFANADAKLTLLDEREVSVSDNTLVISDDSGPIGLAGIMGGLSTAVSDATSNVFFEAAFWPQEYMSGRARSYGLHTDASARFERGVDPEGQVRAVERATELLLEICGGEAGPLVHNLSVEHLPTRKSIRLRRARISKLLGVEISDEIVSGILQRLGLQATKITAGWDVVPPSFRFDITLEADLVEEVARIYGYDNIPEFTAIAETPLEVVTETAIDIDKAASTLVARDYQEVITYSFIDSESDKLLSGIESELVLSNPISSEMSVMRASLWSGMLSVAAANIARQQNRIRLFEIGKSFHGSLDNHEEVERIAGLAMGPVLPEQWGNKSQPVDFFDIKSDIAAMLGLTGDSGHFEYVSSTHAALQPGQTASIIRDGETVGVMGKLHPRLGKHFELKRDVFLFELDTVKALASAAPVATMVSKFPASRRDIAVVVDEKISADELVKAVAATAPNLIREVRVFDIYRGPGIEAGLKSVALGLILQETSRTLTDEDADSAMTAAVQELEKKFAAELRD
jgi:phenylalanyl-tRNA synthetase beta chain